MPRKLEAVYRKSLALPHHLICRICQISKPTLGRYLRAFEHGGLDGLKHAGRPNRLHPHAARLEPHLRPGPSGDRRADRRAAGGDSGAGFPAPPQAETSPDRLGPGPGGYAGETGRPGEVSKINSPQTGRSASGPAGGAVLSCRALCVRRVPGFLGVFGTGVPPLALRPAALQRVGGAGGSHTAGSPLPQRDVYHSPEWLLRCSANWPSAMAPGTFRSRSA